MIKDAKLRQYKNQALLESNFKIGDKLNQTFSDYATDTEQQ